MPAHLGFSSPRTAWAVSGFLSLLGLALLAADGGATRTAFDRARAFDAQGAARALGAPELAKGSSLELLAGPIDGLHHAFSDQVIEPELVVRGQLSGAGELVLTVGADPSRASGVEVAIDARVGQLAVEVRGPSPGERRVAPIAGGAAAFGDPLELELRRGRVELRLGRDRRIALSLPALGAGRLFVGARTGGVNVRDFQIEFRLTPESALRQALRQEARWPAPQRQSPLPWAGPLERFDREVARAKLGEPAQAEFDAILEAIDRGRPVEALKLAEAAARAAPRPSAVDFLVGALALELGGEPRLAERALARLRRDEPSFPDAATLHGDALVQIGRFEAAHAAYSEEAHPARRAAALAWWSWARGEEALALRALTDLAPQTCRRAAARVRLIQELARLRADPQALARFEQGGVLVLSDLDARAARRIHAWIRPFMTSLAGTFGTVEDPGPMLVIALADPARFDLWNARLGGVRFAETIGVYRAGTRTIVLRDDDDERVARDALQHELTHHALHLSGLGAPPLLEEGLAEWIATARPRGRRFEGLGTIPPGRARDALAALGGARSVAPAETLFRAPLGAPGSRASEEYALAWASVAVLAQLPSAAAKDRTALDELIGLLRAGSPDEELKSFVRTRWPELRAEHLPR